MGVPWLVKMPDLLPPPIRRVFGVGTTHATCGCRHATRIHVEQQRYLGLAAPTFWPKADGRGPPNATLLVPSSGTQVRLHGQELLATVPLPLHTACAKQWHTSSSSRPITGTRLEPGPCHGRLLVMAADDRQHPAPETPKAPWRRLMHEVIFEADTPAGKAFDVVLLVVIVVSVIVVMLDSVAEIHGSYEAPLVAAEWTITILFTVEYIARLLCVARPWRYARSFYGIVDLLAIVPTYLSLFLAGAQSLLVIRTLRLVRIFRVFKLTRYLREARALTIALRATRERITVFLVVVLTLILIIGAAMYLIEGGRPDTQFTSIPRSVYWAVVTMTTVGYGDIAPQTVIGQTLAAGVMILGYAIIIVPIGVFSTEILAAQKRGVSTRSCPSCGAEGHDLDATCCKYCGSKL